MPVKKGLSTTQRTLRELRGRGLIADKCERWNPYAGKFGVRMDLFGVLDLIALDRERGIIGIQATSGSGMSSHRRKILESNLALEWIRCGGVLELWGWRKVKKKRGGKLKVWRPRIEVFNESMF